MFSVKASATSDEKLNNKERTMFLRDNKTGDAVEILDLAALFDPCVSAVPGRFHAGEEMQEKEPFEKSSLIFPSGEPLPRCWTDADYRG